MNRWLESTKTPHKNCAEELRGAFTRRDVDVDLLLAEPHPRGPFFAEGFECPHGVTHWIIPTEETLRQWEAEGMPPE